LSTTDGPRDRFVSFNHVDLEARAGRDYPLRTLDGIVNEPRWRAVSVKASSLLISTEN